MKTTTLQKGILFRSSNSLRSNSSPSQNTFLKCCGFSLQRVFVVACIFMSTFSVQSNPLMVVSSPVWDKNTQIFLGNCKNQNKFRNLIPESQWTEHSIFLDLIFEDTPNADWDKLKGYLDFKKIYQKRTTCIFGIAKPDLQNPGILYQMDGTTGKTLQHFVLPFPIQKGHLALSDVFFANTWRTFLAVAVDKVDNSGKGSSLFVFDVTDPNKTLTPLLIYREDELPQILTKPVFIRFQTGHFGISVGGYAEQKGVLQLISLEGLFLPKRLKAGTHPIQSQIALDLENTHSVQKILAEDTFCWWVFDLTDSDLKMSKQLSLPMQIFSETSPFVSVIQDLEVPGASIYFLGRYQEQKGLFVLSHALKMGNLLNESLLTPQLVKAGDYKAIIARYGQLILIPTTPLSVPQDISILSLVDYKSVSTAWELLLAASDQTTTQSTQLLWDPIVKTEVLIILKTGCQLNIVTSSFNEKKYGRTSLHRIHDE